MNALRQRIITGARQHFLAHGFRGVTMDDIAADLGISKKTLYAQFASKKDLVEAVIRDKFQSADRDLQRIADTPGEPAATMLNLVTCMLQHAHEIHPSFVRDINREAPELFQIVQESRRQLVERHMGKVLTEGRKKGVIRRDISTSRMLTILTGTIDALLNPQRIAQTREKPKDMLASIITLFLHGVVIRD